MSGAASRRPVKILVTGAAGQLGRDVVALLGSTGVEVIAADHAMLRVEEVSAVHGLVDAVGPSAIIHAAALTNVDRCETEPEAADAINAVGTANVASAAQRVGAHLVYISTDYVFDGTADRPYKETDPTNPVSVYGATKFAGERACPPSATIVRTSWVAGDGGANFISAVLDLARRDGELRFVEDQRASPTFTPDLARAVVSLAADRRPGRFHVTHSGQASRFELARATLELAGQDPARIVAIATSELHPPRPARRPAYSVLDNAAFAAAGYEPLPPWRDSLGRLVGQLCKAPR
ncbi:MAG: dTDP-4-dehydrorhamnose reductase [Acidimicrobiales bacterium]